jgi:hypothetical protein
MNASFITSKQIGQSRSLSIDGESAPAELFRCVGDALPGFNVVYRGDEAPAGVGGVLVVLFVLLVFVLVLVFVFVLVVVLVVLLVVLLMVLLMVLLLLALLLEVVDLCVVLVSFASLDELPSPFCLRTLEWSSLDEFPFI